MEVKHRLRALAITATVLVAAAACSAQPAAAPSPAPAATTSTPSPTATSPIDGTWVSHFTRADVVREIKKDGLEKWTKDWLAGEEILDNNTVVYRFADGSFQVAYFQKGGIWHVGWKGPYTVAGDEITMVDDFSGITDTYRWEIVDDRLDLNLVKSDSATIDGFPYEIVDATYMRDQWSRSDCAMEAGQDC